MIIHSKILRYRQYLWRESQRSPEGHLANRPTQDQHYDRGNQGPESDTRKRKTEKNGNLVEIWEPETFTV